MGHRAHYAIRRQGETRLFYSHWGARTVPEDAFFGPRHLETFVQRLDRARVWLDDAWAEGGLALDHDTRTLAFFGGDTDEDLIEAWLQLMRALWADWSVRWVDGMPDLAVALDVDPSTVRGEAWARAAPTPPLPSQTPLGEAAPRVWDALSRAEARKDVLYANARQTLGGLPPVPVYGEELANQPQFLVRIPPSWPGPMAAAAAFAFARSVARGAPTAGDGARAFASAIDAEAAPLALDVLEAWGHLGVEQDQPDVAPTLARGLAWLADHDVDVGALLRRLPAWQRWARALEHTTRDGAEGLLRRVRELA